MNSNPCLTHIDVGQTQFKFTHSLTIELESKGSKQGNQICGCTEIFPLLIETYKLSKARTPRATANLITNLQEILDQLAEGNPLSICEGNPVSSIAAAYQGTG